MAGAARMTRLRRVPTVLQLEALECGAAALGMVLAHHGRWTPLVELRRLCGVSRDGSKASSLLRAGRSLGLDADGYRLDIDDLAAIAKPAIVYVNENHFVVLEGMRRGRVEVNDPVGGRVIYTREEFGAIYSGVALTFKPNDAFRRGGERPRVLLPLARRLAGGRAVFVLLVATGIALAVPAMVIPAFTRAFVDQFVIERQDDFVPWLIIAMLGTLVVQLGLLWIQGWAQLALRNRIAVGTASSFTWRVLRMPIAFFGQRSPSSIGARSDMAARLADQASGPLPALAVAIVSAVLFAALMFQYSPTLTTISIGIAATASAVALLSQRKLGEGERKASLDLLKLGSRTMQGLMLLETIKASGTEDEFIEGWTGQQAAVVSQQQRLGRLAGGRRRDRRHARQRRRDGQPGGRRLPRHAGTAHARPAAGFSPAPGDVLRPGPHADRRDDRHGPDPGDARSVRGRGRFAPGGGVRQPVADRPAARHRPRPGA